LPPIDYSLWGEIVTKSEKVGLNFSGPGSIPPRATKNR